MSAITSEIISRETIPRPIYQAATRQLIAAMAPHEVLYVRAESPISHEDRFAAIVRGGDNFNLIFYQDRMEEDVFISLRAVFLRLPDPIIAVSVRDPINFGALVIKSGPGAGGKPKSGNVGVEWYSSTTSDFFAQQRVLLWEHLNQDLIENARKKIPKQTGDIECAANSAARTMILLGVPQVCNYSTVKSDCPRDSDTYIKNTCLFGLFAFCTAGIIAAPFTGGASLEPCLIGTGACATTGMAAEAGLFYKMGLSSGPSLWELAEFIGRMIHEDSRTRSRYGSPLVNTFWCFDKCAEVLARDIRDGLPVIAMFFWSATGWHYANVVGYKKAGDKIDGFMILDTDCTIVYRDYDNMRHYMYNAYQFNSSLMVGGTPNNYNIIRFPTKS